ncbi:hypothetical protein M9H77_26025 [Catharanthus roseus]|uniref:Uncharacterized protein n=1 Tax=Catharanthus roseus TaxID=4058 RepID=A0ACC0A9V4_CATRO|nr:hypothetical protein M9H77_26025 [Catharanthus roseus]
MTKKCCTEDFKSEWAQRVHDCGLERNEYVAKLYCTRGRWVESYLHGQFFGGMRSTQRCEKMNAFLNSHLYEKPEIYEFLGCFDNAILQLRHSNAEADLKTRSLGRHNSRTCNKNLGQSPGLDYVDVATPEEGPNNWEHLI